MFYTSFSCGSLLLLFGAAKGAEVKYNWDLMPIVENAYSPDCMNVKDNRRSMFLANSSFPGPLIEANEGDTITVRVNNNNEMTSVSIHFHGIHQKGTPYSDGAAFVTQCALGPLQSQEYSFQAYPPGTHFWHGHAALNLVDGLTGPIIVHPQDKEPFDFDEEMVIFLQDWYLATGTQQVDGLLSWPFVWIGNPNSLLINGKGIAPECQVNGTHFNVSQFCLDTCLGDPLALVESINVTSGKTYRLRLINAGQLVMMNFAIAGHNMTIVQVEGTNVEPVVVSSLDLASGQRYDVLVKTDQPAASYTIETTIRERNIPGVKGLAIFQYEGVNVTLPVEKPKHPAWNETSFGLAQDMSLKTLNVSQHLEASSLNATNVTRYILVGTQNQYIVNNVTIQLRWAVNNISSIPGSNPTLGKAVLAARSLGWPAVVEGTVNVPLDPPFVWNYTENLTSASGPGVALGTLQESAVQFTHGTVFEFVLQNTRALNGVAEFHPWHSHGHSFWVVGEGKGIYNPDTDIANYNLDNPVLRDTVTLQPLSWVAIRFLADNPGAWLFHCHITAHHVMGMGFVMLVDPGDVGYPSASVEFCDDQQLTVTTSSGNASQGNSSGSSKANSTSSGTYHLGSGLYGTSVFAIILAMLL